MLPARRGHRAGDGAGARPARAGRVRVARRAADAGHAAGRARPAAAGGRVGDVRLGLARPVWHAPPRRGRVQHQQERALAPEVRPRRMRGMHSVRTGGTTGARAASPACVRGRTSAFDWFCSAVTGSG